MEAPFTYGRKYFGELSTPIVDIDLYELFLANPVGPLDEFDVNLLKSG